MRCRVTMWRRRFERPGDDPRAVRFVALLRLADDGVLLYRGTGRVAAVEP